MSAGRAKNFCRFSREMDEKLIQLVASNEVIYNPTHKMYKDMSVRDDVWMAIASVVGKDVQDCKTRWRSLRDLYSRKKKDERKGKRTTQWEYMEMLGFLEEHTCERRVVKMSSNQIPYEVKNEEVDGNFENNYMNLVAVSINMDEAQLDNLKNNANEQIFVPNKKLKLEETNEDSKTSEDESIQLLREIRDAAVINQDPIKIFFDSMAKTVMDFPPALAAEAKLRVCQIVTELECRNLDSQILETRSDD